MVKKKVLCFCENNGLGERYFIKALKKQESIEVSMFTESKMPIIQNYDYLIFFECGREKMQRFFPLLNNINCKKIFFSQDSHINFDMHCVIINQLKFDAIITTQKNAVKRFEETGKPVLYCTWAYDPEINKDLKLKRHYDMGIAGTLNPYLHPMRCNLIGRLSKEFEIFPIAKVDHGEANKVYSSCKIGFNYAIADDVNYRVFEVISSGAMLITDNKPLDNGLKDLFVPGKEIVVYRHNSFKDLKDKIDYYLKHPKERQVIIDNATKRIKEYTYDKRAKEIIKFLVKLDE